ncbi:MAG: acetyl-CoA carboxylase biotin carboxyl carrier protein subunit, partial [Candidatus Bathyarchaeota archaeon]|nr:acetyl-CoA carboxylase biotin carboxyl carrier protein subunit [Candidatus Bathyarchaeota archaeon]
MPSYDVSVDGRLRRVELTRKGDNAFSCKTNGKTSNVEVSNLGTSVGQSFTIKVDGKEYKVELEENESGKVFSVKIEDMPFKVEVNSLNLKQAASAFEPVSAAPARKSASPKPTSVEGAVTAPMTGKVVKVKVKKGDQVKASQVLCVIEAMKMENEIVSPKAGTVQEAKVSEGSPVNEGDTLF